MNDFSNIPSESEFRNEMTVESQEVAPDEHLEMAYEDRTHLDENDEMVDEDDPNENDEPNEDMDGDFDSGMASAGFGTDEDYGYYGGGED
jgi:hypothetical protein